MRIKIAGALHSQRLIVNFMIVNFKFVTAPKKPKAPDIPFPRNDKRFLAIDFLRQFLPSRVPPILAAVSLNRLGCSLPTCRWVLGTQVR